MAKASDWAGKVMGLLQSGNTAAAVGQIKVAPTVKDLKALQSAIIVGRCKGRWPDVEVALADNLDLLSAPSLHRSP